MLSFPLSSTKHIVRYAFFVLLGGWSIMMISLVYQYIIFSTVSSNSRGGTLVQGVVGTTSYLPYIQSFDLAFSYGTLLFKGCLHDERTNNSYSLLSDLCTVTSPDTKVYTLALKTGSNRSDGVPVTMKDVFFTYNDVIKNNKRKLSSVEQYKDIIVSLLPNNMIKVTFPVDSVDNGLLFTLPVLPEHVLSDKTLAYYKINFSAQPVVSSCASLQAQNKDQSSLVFDLTNCELPVNFYQIKKNDTQELFDAYLEKSQTNIIDFVYNAKPLSGYRAYPVVTNSYLGLFFNTQSKKLTLPMRKSLAGLIQHIWLTQIASGSIDFVNNDTYLFPRLSGSGSDILSFFNTFGSDPNTQTITQKSLQDINVPKLPVEIFIQGRNKRAVYYIENTAIPNNLKLRFESSYDRMTIAGGDGKEIDLKLIDTLKKVSFFDISKDQNIKEGLNKYVIKGYRKNQPRVLLGLDMYVLKSASSVLGDQTQYQGVIDPSKQLTLIALSTPANLKTIEYLKNIFDAKKISSYISIIAYEKQSEFEGKLLSKDYDIVLRTFDRGIKKDASSLFMTDQSLINPSLYTNTQLASYIKQYLNTSTDTIKWTIKKELDTLYLNAVPVLLLGRIQSYIYIRSGYNVQWSGAINEANLMYQIMQRINISRDTIRVDRAKVLSWKNFLQFIHKMRFGSL